VIVSRKREAGAMLVACSTGRSIRADRDYPLAASPSLQQPDAASAVVLSCWCSAVPKLAAIRA
jgi:hypothetical protein